MAYNGILFSWGAKENMQPANATFLPILLCQGLMSKLSIDHDIIIFFKMCLLF